MQSRKIIFVFFAAFSLYAITPTLAQTSQKRIVIAASTVCDGKGHVLHNTRIVVEGSKIVAIDPKAAPVDYDLRGLTVMPGWIDADVHISWIFGKDGKNGGAGRTSEEQPARDAANSRVALLRGVPTGQRVGAPTHGPLC